MLPPKKTQQPKKPVAKKPVAKPLHSVGTMTKVLRDNRTGKVISSSTVTPVKSSIREAFKNGGSVKRKKKNK